MNINQVARIGALVGEPARAGMLLALMDGRALTARELATAAHVTPATASRHLGLLVEAGLLRVNPQGRHRYHQLASAEVARLLEGIMQLALVQPRPTPLVTGPRDATLRFARSCYDHLAGRLAVALADRLVEQGAVLIEDDTAVVTDRAAAALQDLGVQSPALRATGNRPANFGTSSRWHHLARPGRTQRVRRVGARWRTCFSMRVQAPLASAKTGRERERGAKVFQREPSKMTTCMARIIARRRMRVDLWCRRGERPRNLGSVGLGSDDGLSYAHSGAAAG